MKTQKLTLVAALTTTLLSTTAFADWTITDFTATNTTQISVSLDVQERCTIKGLDKPNKDLPLVSSTSTAALPLSVHCNSTQLPKLRLQSGNGSGTKFSLKNTTGDSVNYDVTYGTTKVDSGVQFALAAASTDLTFTAHPTDDTPIGTFTDTITATVTL